MPATCQPMQRAVKQLDRLHGRVKRVEQVPRHNHRIHSLLVGHPHNLIHHSHLLPGTLPVIQPLSKMPI